MKTLIMAIVFFGLVCWGLYDVEPYKRVVKRVLRRTPRQDLHVPTPPLEPAGYDRRRRPF